MRKKSISSKICNLSRPITLRLISNTLAIFFYRDRCSQISSREEINNCVRTSDDGELMMKEISKAMRKIDGLYDVWQLQGRY